MSTESTNQSMLEKADQTLFGFILGLVLPMLMFFAYREIKFDYLPWNEYIASARDLSVLPSFIKVCVFINLPVFFLFNLLKKFLLCKGIFIASILYIAAMFIVKYVV
ncbi:MAG TPA: hypothetical protein PLX60_08205 [Chitinophagales bacterium]|jgi:hypothetical protein|nr:hypothetical protein [Chitinophagales bacterium]HPH88537.1 hypothetical protein [Chitinophagales bacterium]